MCYHDRNILEEMQRMKWINDNYSKIRVWKSLAARATSAQVGHRVIDNSEDVRTDVWAMYYHVTPTLHCKQTPPKQQQHHATGSQKNAKTHNQQNKRVRVKTH
jgi:hypothetical protein